MPLVDRLPAGFPHRDRLHALERVHIAAGKGSRERRACTNFHQALRRRLLELDLFHRFCQRLGELLPDPPGRCHEEAVLPDLDANERFYCRGPAAPTSPDVLLINVREAKAAYRARFGKRPLGTAHLEWLEQAATLPPTARHPLTLRGRRPFFWVARSDDISAAGSSSPDGLRNLLGLSDYKKGQVLVEARFTAGSIGPLHRPTVLDALDGPTFYPTTEAGWGRTDNLDTARTADGVAEAVAEAARVECRIVNRGELTADPRRF